MTILDTKVMQGFIRLCSDGWAQGWHERNGGNLSYRVTDDEARELKPFFNADGGEWVPAGVCAPNLAGELFIVTGSGKFFRNVELEPQNSLCVAQINEAGDSYRVVWGLQAGGRPTSEFPSHLLNHSVR